MRNSMQPLLPEQVHSRDDSVIELSPHARLPRLDLGVEWESRGHEFSSSLASVFRGPRAPKDSEIASDGDLRVDWVEGRLPFRAFTLSSFWHVGMVWLLILPIWGFLPHTTPNLAPVQIELTWYGEPKDLPPISLPARTLKAVAPRSRPQDAKPAEQQGADAFHPRQTILSIPVRVTHPRQTLIRPDAPAAPPKIVPQLPNIVQWNATPELTRPKFQLSATVSAPKVRQRKIQNVAAPEVPNNQKNGGPMNIGPQTVTLARPQIPLSAMSAPKVREHNANPATSAPEIGASATGEAAMRNIIALSATPGPPVPALSVPEGNLAARISVSPAGTKPAEPGGSANHGASSAAGGSSAGAGASALSTGGTGSSSLPAAVSISGGLEPHPTSGGLASGAGRSGGLNLSPREPYQPTTSVHRSGAAEVSKMAPGLPPEKILSGSEIYTMHVNLPNVTSASGSWILNFAELDEDREPGYRKKARLADPVPLHVTDPKYPQELIKGHVQGEVVLYAIIRKSGSVDSIQIVRDLDPELDQDAIDALQKWTFEPATRSGVPVDVEAVIHVPFSYTDPRE